VRDVYGFEAVTFRTFDRCSSPFDRFSLRFFHVDRARVLAMNANGREAALSFVPQQCHGRRGGNQDASFIDWDVASTVP
jgi:hypothetical protein